MNMMKLCVITGAVMGALPPATVFAEEVTEFSDYVVQPGDTCTSIAEKFFGDKRRYDYIHAYNDLSADNHACIAGRTLKIAKLPPLPDALVAQKAGEVQARGPEQPGWGEAQPGMDLYSAWRVNTLQRARAEIAFQDTSTLLMSANTLVIIYGQSKTTSAVTPAHTELVSGRLRSRLDELAGARVDTPTSTTTLGTGQAQLTVEDDGLTRVENHRGAPATVEGKAGGKIAVDKGMGTRVRPNEKPEPPRPLPPTPAWEKTESVALGFAGFGSTISLTWRPVSQAQMYYVELARDARGIDVVESTFVPADKTQLDIQGVPQGTYFAVISSVDGDKFESIPSAAHFVRSAAVALPTSALTRAEDGSFHVVLGTRVRVPKNMSCRTSPEGTFADSPTFDRAGDAALECKIGEDIGSVPVRVDVPTTERADERTLSTGGARVVHWRFVPGAPADVAFSAENADVLQTMRTEDGYALKLRALTTEPVRVTARLGETTLGTATYTVDGQAAGRVEPPDVFQIGVLGGYTYYDGIEALDAQAAGASVHFQGSLLPTKYVGLGLSLGAGQYGTAVLDWRANVMAGMLESDARPFVALGMGGFFEEGHTSTYHLAVGAMPRVSEHFGWSVEAGAVFAPANEELNPIPQARAGLWWSFK